MSEQTYGEHLYDYLISLDYEGLNFEEAEAREWVREVEALLNVARAAEAAWPFIFDDIPTALNTKRKKYKKLYDALKEVEHLLG